MTRANTKKYFIKTYGCQMNVYDSERMAEALSVAGYQPVDAPEAADMVILNTCHIREKAAEKVYSELGRLKPLKQANADMIIGVAGCVAQAEGEEMIHRAPLVDMVFGPQTYQQLPDMISDLDAGRRDGGRVRLVRTEFPAEEKFAALNAAPRRPITRAPTAFVTVQEGCDKFCTFCVVPYTRGAEVSRATADIVDEATRAGDPRRVRNHACWGKMSMPGRIAKPVCGWTDCWRHSRKLRALNACGSQPAIRAIWTRR